MLVEVFHAGIAPLPRRLRLHATQGPRPVRTGALKATESRDREPPGMNPLRIRTASGGRPRLTSSLPIGGCDRESAWVITLRDSGLLVEFALAVPLLRVLVPPILAQPFSSRGLTQIGRRNQPSWAMSLGTTAADKINTGLPGAAGFLKRGGGAKRWGGSCWPALSAS